MWPEPPPLFPDWLRLDDIRSQFAIVDKDPQVTTLTLSYHVTVDDLARFRALREPHVPLVVFYTLDDFHDPAQGGWDRPAGWADAIRQFALDADLLVGAQLPVDLTHERYLALPFAPVVPFADAPGPHAIATAQTDLYFSGAWYPVIGSEPPTDSRDRSYRAYLVDQLRAGLPSRVLELRRVHFWRTNPLDPGGPAPPADLKETLLAEHLAALDRTQISLAPVGYGYLTTRHADTLARGRPLLTEPIHRYLHLPEPDRWEAGDLALFYQPQEHDVVEVVAKALTDHSRLQSIAEEGWRYAQRYLRPDRQVHRLAAAIRLLLAE
jgi:hypothetical protein